MIRRLACLLLPLLLTLPAHGQVIERFDGAGKTIALTFDACQAQGGAIARLDQGITRVLLAEQVPFTIFAGGLFVQNNWDDLRPLAALPQVEIENHSWNHPQHMERLSAEQIGDQLAKTDRIITSLTGRKPKYFRFPAGNYDAASLKTVENSGHRVVHWRWPSGDPANGLTAAHLSSWVQSQTRPGDILIFHINGRAPATAAALPGLIAHWRKQGYQFVRLDQVLP